MALQKLSLGGYGPYAAGFRDSIVFGIDIRGGILREGAAGDGNGAGVAIAQFCIMAAFNINRAVAVGGRSVGIRGKNVAVDRNILQVSHGVAADINRAVAGSC